MNNKKSKIVTLAGGLSLAAIAVSNAAVIETFAYADGALAGQVGGTGWTSAWADTFSRNSGNFTVVGGIASSLNDGSRFTRNLDITYSVGVVYLDLLLEVSNTDDDPFAAIELYNGSANGNDNDRAFSLGTLRGVDVTDNLAAFSQPVNSTSILASSDIVTFNADQNRYVVRFDFTADTANIFYNPTAATDLTVGGDVSIAIADGIGIDRIGIANFGDQSSPSAAGFDNIYFGTDVPVIPEPSTALLGLLGALGLIRRRP